MRRFALGLAATVTLLVLTLSFKTSAGAGHGAALAPAHAPATPANKTPSSAGGTKTVTGAVANTPYGPVQVRVTIVNGRIAHILAIQTPSDAQRSQQIANYAVPILRNEAVKAQSAHIDAVSGATYTSEGYAQSLQSALDSAGFRG
jgi:uncharacterized protein with FMN-binding domain